eukprot:GCRY01001697.1.p1 GENE.GCRY01001697.1~~GCRY01001697.1.p1  ORF type:complete len:394 (-),score=51.22 GCRY01001697.1:2060-3241(-)
MKHSLQSHVEEKIQTVLQQPIEKDREADLISRLSKAIFLKPEEVKLYQRRAEIFLDLGDVKGAIANLESVALLLKRWEVREKEMQASLYYCEVEEELARLHFELGQSYLYENIIQHAIEEFSYSIDLTPENYLTWAFRATAYIGNNQLRLALADASHLRTVGVDDLQVLSLIALVYLKCGSLSDAFEVIRKLEAGIAAERERQNQKKQFQKALENEVEAESEPTDEKNTLDEDEERKKGEEDREEVEDPKYTNSQLLHFQSLYEALWQRLLEAARKYIALADEFAVMGKLPQAVQALDTYLLTSPTNALICTRKATFLRRLGEFSKAVDILVAIKVHKHHAITIAPLFDEYWSLMLMNNRLNRVLPVLSFTLSTHSNNAEYVMGAFHIHSFFL